MINKKYIIFTIMSTLMLSVSRLLLAHISQSNLFLIAPIQWVKSYARIFKFCYELLATSTFLFSSYIIFFILHSSREENYFIISIIIVSLIYCIIAWVGIVLIIWNIVYPVNGVVPLRKSELSTATLQIYSRLHLSDLALGILTISLSCLSLNLYVKLGGYVVGIMQILFTYYSKRLNYNAYLFTVIAWNIWIIAFQIINQ